MSLIERSLISREALLLHRPARPDTKEPTSLSGIGRSQVRALAKETFAAKRLSLSDVEHLLDRTGYSPLSAPFGVRKILGRAMAAHIEHMDAGAQQALHAFVNPHDTARPVWTGVGVTQHEPRFSLVRGNVSYTPSFGQVFEGRPRVSGLQQGQDGDCWLDASAVAKVEMDAHGFRSRFHTLPSGKVRVTFSTWQNDGSFKHETSVVSRAMPRESGSIIFDRDPRRSGDLWAAVMEKAAARTLFLGGGSYDGINGGWPFVALTALTVMKPVLRSIALAEPEELFARMQLALADRRPMVADTYALQGNQAAFAASGGIIDSHAYTVLDAKMIEGKPYVNLRNPWASAEPVGVGFNNGKDDGTFWYPFDKFREVYRFVTWVEPKDHPEVMQTPNDAYNYIKKYGEVPSPFVAKTPVAAVG